MNASSNRKIIWVRHAPIAVKGVLCGRIDVDILPINSNQCRRLQSDLGSHEGAKYFSSPAKRCLGTAAAVLANCDPVQISDFWEIDFGDMEGTRLSELPDIGARSLQEIAQHSYTNGESHLDVTERVICGIQKLPMGTNIVFAHAGVIRAAIGIALEEPAKGLAFTIDHLSQTVITEFPKNNSWSIEGVNMKVPRQ